METNTMRMLAVTDYVDRRGMRRTASRTSLGNVVTRVYLADNATGPAVELYVDAGGQWQVRQIAAIGARPDGLTDPDVRLAGGVVGS